MPLLSICPKLDPSGAVAAAGERTAETPDTPDAPGTNAVVAVPIGRTAISAAGRS